MARELASPLAERVAHALHRPLRRGMRRAEHLFFVSIYPKIDGHDAGLLKLARLGFNLLQNLYQKELKVLTKWWIELDLPRKLYYARDKLLENYFWAMGCLWEPKFSLSRYCFMKLIPIASMYDDTFDAYGKLDELEQFTAAIHRWDTSTKDLNTNMKILFDAVIDSYDDIQEITSNEFGRSYCWEYGKPALKNVVRLYLEEARWLAKGYVPTLEEYRHISSLSTIYQWAAFSVFCGMGDELAPKELFDWLFTEPKMLVASSDQCRLMDDIMTHEFEQKRGHAPSSVECYVEQYGVSTQKAVDALSNMVEEDWKIMNGELLNPPDCVPRKVLSIFLAFAQIMDVLYKDSDGYTNSATTTKDLLTALLVTPFPISS
ncbi:unnamed protein product [Linum trigynum]|uniref:Terpene synthase metal-binding domain-containing protein n=2 Tax=Linum trigynum TaxID=586398 RepID=A0AAV2F4A3_9ROSI